MPPAPAFRYCLIAVALTAAAAIDRVAAETVEVAPGVEVTKTTFSAPANQQPFFGFVELTPRQREANAEFIASLERATGSREKAFEETVRRGWSAFFAGKLPEAAQRFNQAYLLDPTQSQVFHGLGLIAFERFRDPVFADELLRIARTKPNPSTLLNADYGRFLLVAKRPRDAEQVLEQAVVDAPRFPTAWSNLAWSRLQNGKSAGACEAANRAEQLSPPTNVQSDIALLREQAGCG